MPPCHTTPFVRPGLVIQPGSEAREGPCDCSHAERCDFCGSEHVEWRKCKLICTDCRQINKSCADL
jgi:hypothetical protein